MLTVHRDVDGELAGNRVGPSDGDRPHQRLPGGRKVGEGIQRQRVWQRGHVNVFCDEDQLHVGVGEFAGRERVETVAAQHNSNHVRHHLFGAHHFKRVHWSSGHLVPLLRH